MRMTLRNTDHTVVSVYNGEKAFHEFCKREYDVVLLDVVRSVFVSEPCVCGL